MEDGSDGFLVERPVLIFVLPDFGAFSGWRGF